MFQIIRAESKKCLPVTAFQPFPKNLAPKASSSKAATFLNQRSQKDSQKRRSPSHGFRQERNGSSTLAKLVSKTKVSTAPTSKVSESLTNSLIITDTSVNFKTSPVPTERCCLEVNTCQLTSDETDSSNLSKPSTRKLFSITGKSCFPSLSTGELTINMRQVFKPRTQCPNKNVTPRNYSTKPLMTPAMDFSTTKATRKSYSIEIPTPKTYSTNSLFTSHLTNLQKRLQQKVPTTKNYSTNSLFTSNLTNLQKRIQQKVPTTKTYSTNSLFTGNLTNLQKRLQHKVPTTKNYSTKSLFTSNLTNLQKRLQQKVPTTKNYSTKSSDKLRLISPQEAAAHVKPNTVVFVEGVVGTPKVLMNAMYDHVKGNNIQGVTVLDVFSLYPYESMTLEDDCVRRLSFFVSPYTRPYVNAGKAEYVPLMLNDLPLMFSRRYFSPEVALISVSPPDSAGFVSLGTNVTELLDVIAASKVVIAQINDKMPRSQGAAIIHVDQIDFGVEVSYELFTPVSESVTDLDRTIANLICEELIEDEATLQIGLGKIPEAILSQISQHKNLGVHTELLTTSMLPLIQGGIINNSKKSIDRDIITATLLLGDKALYDYVNNNETVQMKPCNYSNDPAIIRQNHRMTAINTCLEIDLTGQVVSDSIGSAIYSGFGGQVDFMRGAMTSLDGKGKAILALPSCDERTGRSKIVSRLTPGAGVVCTRAHVQHLATEYGRAELCGRSTRQRAHDLIQLAHPNHRERLEREAYELLGVMPCA